MKVAVVHEWLESYVGSERVLEQILLCYPDADLFAVADFLPADQRGFLRDRAVTTSFIQRLPFARRRFRHYLLLMPLAVEQFDLSDYDLVITSNHAVAKGVLTGPDQLHISYVHTPIRYAWDLQHQYLRQAGLDRGLRSWLARWMLHKMRLWDHRTANGVDVFVANSHYVARRITKVYRREADVIYPPVDVAGFILREDKEDFYLAVSRMVPYKRIDVIVRAFTAMPERRLVVIGDGPELGKIKSLAGPNVAFLGFQPENSLKNHMQRARAFIFAAEEDFGIVPLEAQACGTAVIAYGKGGAKETIAGLEAEAPTGVLFDAQEPESLMEAVTRFERDAHLIKAEACRSNAKRFAPDQFRSAFKKLVAESWEHFERRYQ
jgi:glycosyltransferase involved in cell wall biosynthesis